MKLSDDTPVGNSRWGHVKHKFMQGSLDFNPDLPAEVPQPTAQAFSELGEEDQWLVRRLVDVQKG